jgi:hypothetical protein
VAPDAVIFPFNQPYKKYWSIKTRDILHPEISSDSFFYPKRTDLFWKYVAIYSTLFIPGFDLFMLIIDTIYTFVESNSSYDNFLAQYIYGGDSEESIIWIFQYYDLFTWQGLLDYWMDKYILIEHPWFFLFTETQYSDFFVFPVDKNQLSYLEWWAYGLL